MFTVHTLHLFYVYVYTVGLRSLRSLRGCTFTFTLTPHVPHVYGLPRWLDPVRSFHVYDHTYTTRLVTRFISFCVPTFHTTLRLYATHVYTTRLVPFGWFATRCAQRCILHAVTFASFHTVPTRSPHSWLRYTVLYVRLFTFHPRVRLGYSSYALTLVRLRLPHALHTLRLRFYTVGLLHVLVARSHTVALHLHTHVHGSVARFSLFISRLRVVCRTLGLRLLRLLVYYFTHVYVPHVIWFYVPHTLFPAFTFTLVTYGSCGYVVGPHRLPHVLPTVVGWFAFFWLRSLRCHYHTSYTHCGSAGCVYYVYWHTVGSHVDSVTFVFTFTHLLHGSFAYHTYVYFTCSVHIHTRFIYLFYRTFPSHIWFPHTHFAPRLHILRLVTPTYTVYHTPWLDFLFVWFTGWFYTVRTHTRLTPVTLRLFAGWLFVTPFTFIHTRLVWFLVGSLRCLVWSGWVVHLHIYISRSWLIIPFTGSTPRMVGSVCWLHVAFTLTYIWFTFGWILPHTIARIFVYTFTVRLVTRIHTFPVYVPGFCVAVRVHGCLRSRSVVTDFTRLLLRAPRTQFTFGSLRLHSVRLGWFVILGCCGWFICTFVWFTRRTFGSTWFYLPRSHRLWFISYTFYTFTTPFGLFWLPHVTFYTHLHTYFGSSLVYTPHILHTVLRTVRLYVHSHTVAHTMRSYGCLVPFGLRSFYLYARTLVHTPHTYTFFTLRHFLFIFFFGCAFHFTYIHILVYFTLGYTSHALPLSFLRLPLDFA